MSPITQATETDYPELCALLDAANAYSMKQSGVPQWTAMQHAYDSLAKQIKASECFIIRNKKGDISSAIVVSARSTDWPESDPHRALYVYKLMKNPDKAEAAEGRHLLAFAARQALRRRRSLLRCDTVTESPGLVSYYKNLGFAEKGKFTYTSSGREGVLLEASAKAILESAGHV